LPIFGLSRAGGWVTDNLRQNAHRDCRGL
jgi:hypothetical protein